MFAPIYIKTEYSLLESMIRIPELITYAKENHIKALAITDNNLSGVMEFYKACQNEQIKPMIGLEVMFEKEPVLLYAKNETGYHNLLKLSTIQSEREVTLDELETYREELVCILPYDSRLLETTLNKIYEIIYLGYTTREQRESLDTEKKLYVCHALALKKEDTNYVSYLEAIDKGILEEEVLTEHFNHYLKTEQELKEEFSSLDCAYEVCDLCQVTFTKSNELLLPIYPCEEGYDSYSYLKKLCVDGLRKKFGTTVRKVYVDRLKYELSVIEKMGFSNYFLIVADYINYAKEHGVLVGPGRGSAAGSLVSYCLNITTVDPIKEDLLFERFLNPERVSMPDIDIDFEFQKREQVIQYVQEKYGVKRVSGIITFGTLASKQVIRDVARSMDIDLKQVDALSKLLDSRKTLTENMEGNDKLRRMINQDKTLSKLYQISLKLEGLKRHTSIHAAGIVMCKTDLDNVIPLSYNHEGFYVTGFSMEYLEELGLLKMDFLALRNLTLIQDVLDSLKQYEKLPITFDEIPFHDEKAISIFTNVLTEGIFQFESAGMKNFLRKFKPNSFSEIAVSLALFRPGPMNNIDEFIRRKRGKSKVTYLHPDLEPILKETQGIIVYQEQIMQIASKMAGYTYGQADVLRRAMSKKKESVLIKEKERFVKGSIARGYEEKIANEVYELILKFASYGFNKAHSVAYAIISYKMAYLKAHYPKYFMKSLLSMAIGSSEKTREYIYECKLLHIDVLKPDINESEEEFKVVEHGILYPLSGIKNVGVSAIETILEERKKNKFTSIYDFLKRCYGKSLNRKTLDSMIDAGILSTFGYNRKTLHQNLDLILNYVEIIKDVDESFVEKPELVVVDEYDTHTLMNLELQTFGFYLSNHPVTEYKLSNPKSIPLAEVENYFDKEIELICLVDKLKEITTKKNEKMAFLNGSDEISKIEVVLFPRTYENVDIHIGDIIKVFGKVEKRFDKYQIVVRKITILKKEEA